MPRSGKILRDDWHQFSMLVFRGDPDQRVDVTQVSNGAGLYGSPVYGASGFPFRLSAINAECWSTALLAAARRARRMARYTGRPVE